MFGEGRERGWALAAIGMLLVSTDSFFIRAADFDVWTISFLFGAASTIALGTAFSLGDNGSVANAVSQRSGTIALIVALSSATQLAFIGAVNNTAVSNVVVIVAGTPIVSAALAWVILRERTERRVAIAIAATVAGIAIVVTGSLGSPTLDGDLLAMLAVVLVSFTLILWRRHPDINRPLVLAMSSATMAIVCVPFASLASAPGRVFVAAGLMGLVFNPLGRVSYTTAPRFAPTAEVALFSPVETVAATIWAWLCFSERPSFGTVVGGFVVIAAVIYGTIGGRHPRSRLVATTPTAAP